MSSSNLTVIFCVWSGIAMFCHAHTFCECLILTSNPLVLSEFFCFVFSRYLTLLCLIPQHTPVNVGTCTRGQIQNPLPHANKECLVKNTLKAECYFHSLFPYFVGNKKISNIQVIQTLAAGGSPILCH